MQHAEDAAIGAWNLNVEWSPSTTRGRDSRRAISLVGSSSTSARTQDPIVAARRWVDDPARASSLDPIVRLHAHQAIDVAARHLRALDALAAELAESFEAGVDVDPMRIAHVGELASVFERFSERLRRLLGPDHDPADRVERLERAVRAAEHGGLGGLVAEL